MVKTPTRWKQIVTGLALGYNQTEVAEAIGSNPASVSASLKDIQSTVDQYDTVGDFLEDVLDVEGLEVDLDTAAVQAYRENSND